MKSFIKEVSYGQILFHEKCNTNEYGVELGMNSLYVSVMTKINIAKSQLKVLRITGYEISCAVGNTRLECICT
jgi:hypothetical protein